MSKKFKQGEIVWLNMNPSAGHEQQGWRPALIASNAYLNQTGMYWVCPITTKDKEQFPTRIALDDRTETKGFIQVDQLRSMDLEAHHATKKEVCPDDILEDVLETVKELVVFL